MLTQAENENMAIERGLENLTQDLRRRKEECKRLQTSCSRLESDNVQLTRLLEQARTECSRLEAVAEDAVVVAEQGAATKQLMHPSSQAKEASGPENPRLAQSKLSASSLPDGGGSPNPLYSPLHASVHTAAPSLGISQLELAPVTMTVLSFSVCLVGGSVGMVEPLSCQL